MNLPLSQPIISEDPIIKASSPSHNAQEPELRTWHHDCSNTSGFIDIELPRFSITSYDNWFDSKGIIESDGQSLHLTNITEPSDEYGLDYYGPVIVCDLPNLFPVSGLRRFQAQMEMNNSAVNVSAVAVTLFDETLSPVLTASCRDRSSVQNGSSFSLQYYPRNFSILNYYFEKNLWQYGLGGVDESLDYANTTWSASYIHNLGITGHIPSWGTMDALDGEFVAMNEVDTARAIKYLGVMIGGYYDNGFYPISSSRVHDIVLEYEIGGVVDTLPPVLTPQPDMEYIFGHTGNSITWNCTDDHPYRFWLFERFQDLPLEEGLWNGSPISMSIDGLELGNYGFTLLIQDKAGFIVGDYVKVYVIEDPIIIAIFGFVSANALLILVFSIVAIGCVLDLRSRREAARLRGEAWSRSLKKQTNNDSLPTDRSHE